MNIKELELDFSVTPLQIQDDIVVNTNRRILVCTENLPAIDIPVLHQDYKNAGFTGLPYHYVIQNEKYNGEDGTIYYCRPTIYQNEIVGDFSFNSNCVTILLCGKASVLSDAQKTSLVDLLVFVCQKEGIFPDNILHKSQIIYGDNPIYEWQDIIDSVYSKLNTISPLMAVKNADGYYKMFAQDKFDTLSSISKYTGLEPSFIQSINPHVTQSTISHGTILFLPYNKIYYSSLAQYNCSDADIALMGGM